MDLRKEYLLLALINTFFRFNFPQLVATSDVVFDGRNFFEIDFYKVDQEAGTQSPHNLSNKELERLKQEIDPLNFVFVDSNFGKRTGVAISWLELESFAEEEIIKQLNGMIREFLPAEIIEAFSSIQIMPENLEAVHSSFIKFLSEKSGIDVKTIAEKLTLQKPTTHSERVKRQSSTTPVMEK